MRLWDKNWMQIEEYLRHDDRVVVPIGSTEQHGYLSLGTDALLAERVSVEAAEPLGVPVLPVVPFGMAPVLHVVSRIDESAIVDLHRGPARRA